MQMLRKLHRVPLFLSYLLILSLISSSVVFAQSKPVDDKWALVVGISKFKDPSMNLKYPAKDAHDFAQFLIKEGNFAADHVRLVTDEQATRSGILSELGDKWLPKVAAPNDLVVIYISSHGSPSKMDNEGCNYLVAHDTEKSSLFATGISLQNLSNIIKERVHSERVLVILDACHSGSAKAKTGKKGIVRQGNFNPASFPMGKGIILVCSSEPSQVSWESKRYDNGVFTKQLIDGFKYRGKYTKLGEAFKLMQKQVQQEVLNDRGELQSPVIKSAWKGDDIIIASKPLSPRPGISQPPLRKPSPVEAANSPLASSIPLNSEVHRAPVANTASMIGGQAIGVKLMDRVAILPVVGPKEFILKGGLKGWFEKYKINPAQKYKGKEVNATIQQRFQKELLKRMKKKGKDVILLTFDDIGGSSNTAEGSVKLDSKSMMNPQSMINWTNLGRMAQAKYLLEITVHNVELEDHYMGDLMAARVSARLVDASTGEVLWLQKRRKYSRSSTESFHSDPMYGSDMMFSELKNFIPSKVAKDLAKPVVNCLKDQ